MPEYSQMDHPDWYAWHPSGTKCIDIIKHFGFLPGSIIKYVWRSCGPVKKGEPLKDLRKARDYLNELIEQAEAELPKAEPEERVKGVKLQRADPEW